MNYIDSGAREKMWMTCTDVTLVERRRSRLRCCKHKDFELSYDCSENEVSMKHQCCFE
jgi:hypothetical protein